jgi:hypothetical protein
VKITKRQLRRIIREAMDYGPKRAYREPEHWPRVIVPTLGLPVKGLPGEPANDPAVAYWDYPGIITLRSHVPALGHMQVAATPNWDDVDGNTLAIDVTADDGTMVYSFTVENIPWTYEADEDRALWLQAIREQWPKILKAMRRFVR